MSPFGGALIEQAYSVGPSVSGIFNASVNVWLDPPPGHRSTVNERRTKRRTFGVRRDVRKKFPEECETYAFFSAMKQRRTTRRTPYKTYNGLMDSTRIRRYFERRTNNVMQVE